MDDNRIHRLEKSLTEINSTLVRNTVTLEEHVRRTNILETDLIQHKTMDEAMHATFKSYIDTQRGMMKAVTALIGVPAVLYYTVSLLHMLVK